MIDLLNLLAVLVLVLANGFFVAAEFALVAVRRSRVDQLADAGRRNARTLQRVLEKLDRYLAATQLGITIASLALGWVGEPALAHLVEPLLLHSGIPDAQDVSHVIGVILAFLVITALHIVLGELAPKSLALQRSEVTALTVVRPLLWFETLLRPAITLLNWLGNAVLRLFGLSQASEGHEVHSPEELKLIVAASRQAGLIKPIQQDVVERAISLGTMRIEAIMTPRRSVEWIDADLPRTDMLARLRACRHDQVLVGRAAWRILLASCAGSVCSIRF